MEYSESYIYSKDIDWFFKINNRYIHVASAGGKLPAIINDREKLRQTQYQVYNLPYIFLQKKYTSIKVSLGNYYCLSLMIPQNYIALILSLLSISPEKDLFHAIGLILKMK